MHLAVDESTIGLMTDGKVKRRLTTILCADVHGYSRLMAADEAGTLGTLRRYRAAIAGLVERHDGRIVNTWGDAMIAEFASVVEAVQCAVEIQREIPNQDTDLPDAHQMRFRIGVNLGDVMVDGSDIFGDGVNIAARLQEIAEPGGVDLGWVREPASLDRGNPHHFGLPHPHQCFNQSAPTLVL